jgi:hypothetical protein
MRGIKKAFPFVVIYFCCTITLAAYGSLPLFKAVIQESIILSDTLLPNQTSSAKTIVIPDSILNSLKQFSNELIGISDPGLDSLTGYNQAIFRAVLINSLSYSNRINQVEDNFLHTNDGKNRSKTKGVFSEMYSVETIVSLPKKSNVIINWSTKLSSGEYIVAIDPTPLQNDSLKSSFPVKFLLFHKVNEAGSLYQLFRLKYKISKIIFPEELISFSDSLDFFWINQDKKRFNRVFCENSSLSMSHKFFYRGMNGYFRSTTSDEQGMSISTIYGLWPALINGITWQLPVNMQSDSLVIREVGDFYNSLALRLNRTIQSSKVTFNLTGVRFSGGLLTTEISPSFNTALPQEKTKVTIEDDDQTLP